MMGQKPNVGLEGGVSSMSGPGEETHWLHFGWFHQLCSVWVKTPGALVAGAANTDGSKAC